jgi:predicted ester cyclase
MRSEQKAGTNAMNTTTIDDNKTTEDSGMLIGEGHHVVARLRVVGKHTGSHPRMPGPAGRDFDVEQIWIFTLADGLITEIRAVSDRLGMFLQLGWDWPSAG